MERGSRPFKTVNCAVRETRKLWRPWEGYRGTMGYQYLARCFVLKRAYCRTTRTAGPKHPGGGDGQWPNLTLPRME